MGFGFHRSVMMSVRTWVDTLRKGRLDMRSAPQESAVGWERFRSKQRNTLRSPWSANNEVALVRHTAFFASAILLLLLMMACGGTGSTAAQESSSDDVHTQQRPTATPAPQLPGMQTPAPPSPNHRLNLGDGVVVAFVEGLSPDLQGKVAYVTHVSSGSQAVLDKGGRIIERHDGRGDGPSRLEAALSDAAAMGRITEGLQSNEDARPAESVALWPHSFRFGGITYVAKGGVAGPVYVEGERALTREDLGLELYRVAFRREGYTGGDYYQDGDAVYLNPGTRVYTVKGYAPEFRLGVMADDGARLFEVDTNPLARVGEDLLDVRGRVTAVDILSSQERWAQLASVSDAGMVEGMVELLLQAPVDQTHQDRTGPRYRLALRLEDGTAAVRSFWPESGARST